MFHHHPVWLALGGGPGGPTNETVDRVAVLRLVQWELVATPVELIAPILQPVRPRDQHLAPARGTHLIGTIAVEKLTDASRVCAESPANLDDHSLLIFAYDRDLLAGWCDHPSHPLAMSWWAGCCPPPPPGRSRCSLRARCMEYGVKTRNSLPMRLFLA